ncbi:reverse transcriptase [compost metagenome]
MVGARCPGVEVFDFGVVAVFTALPAHRFVFRTDVKSYYASMSHKRLMADLAGLVSDPHLLHLLAQYLSRTAERGGLFWEHTRGIPLACSLSPLLGGFYLYRLDVALTRPDVFYLRYMDDVLVLTSTRHKLRQAVRVVNQLFEVLELQQHPDKTYIGPIERGFTFLGRHYPAQ